MDSKVCSKCKQGKLISEFFVEKRAADGYQAWCKACHNKHQREYLREYRLRAEEETHLREYRRKYMKKYRQRPYVKIKTFASNYVCHAIERGRLKREPCALCGAEQVQAHHPDYSEPFLIVWLCPVCHRELHLTLKKERME